MHRDELKGLENSQGNAFPFHENTAALFWVGCVVSLVWNPRPTLRGMGSRFGMKYAKNVTRTLGFSTGVAIGRTYP